MIRYLLDTDICIYVSNRHPAQVAARLEEIDITDLGMSVITYFELVYGAYNSREPERNLAAAARLSRVVPVQPLTTAAAHHYGRLRAELKREGTPIGGNDLLIAAHALALDATLVTNNVREFHRIAGLRVENWA